MYGTYIPYVYMLQVPIQLNSYIRTCYNSTHIKYLNDHIIYTGPKSTDRYKLRMMHLCTINSIVLMIITGVFVNGPYAMITTAVSADLVSSLCVATV